MRRGRLVAAVAGAAGIAVLGRQVWLARESALERETREHNPVVLCHGFMGGYELPVLGHIHGMPSVGYFRGVAEFVEEETERAVLVTTVPALGSIDERARRLAAQIELFVAAMREQTGLPDLRVNIIAHSMGGLDARRAVHLLQGGEVASITTIASPHHGTALARNLVLPAALRGFSDLSGQAMGKWECPDLPGVLYFSVGGAAEVSPLHPLYLAQQLLHKLEPGPNDGLVTVASSHYGSYLFTAPLDHWAQIGWTSHMDDSHIRLLYRPILDNLTALHI